MKSFRASPRSSVHARLNLLACAVAGLTACLPGPAAAQAELVREIDRFLQRHKEEIPTPGFSAVVVKDGKVLFQGGYGVKTLGESTPVTAQTPIAIGSQTKSFTAVAVMQLVEQGRVDLDAPVVQYLPWFRTADQRGAEVTVRHLLHNTSGIPSRDRWLFSKDTTEAAAEKDARSLSLVPLVRNPGQSFEYSNENWTLAGLIVSAVTGMSYSGYMQEHVLDPMGMTNSSTNLARLVDMDVSWGYFAGPDDTVRPAKPRFLGGALAAGSELRASAEDMGRYLIMLTQEGEYQGEQILSPASVETIFTPGVYTTMTMPEMGVIGEEAGYAMGWVEAMADGRTIIQHGGNAIVMGSWTAIDPEQRVAASLLYNGPENYAYNYPTKVWVVNNLLHLASGEPTSDFGLPKESDPTLNSYELPVELLDRYQGVYVSNEGYRLEILEDPERDRLLLRQDVGTFEYERVIDFASEAGAVLRDLSGANLTTFVMTPDGEVTGLVGGVAGGTYRKRGADELAGIQDVASPTGTVTFQLPQEWEVEWEGKAFQARAGDENGWTLVGDAGESSWEDLITALGGTAPEGGTGQALERSETVGRYVWRELIWADGEGGIRRQHMLAYTEDGGTRFHVMLSTPFGERTDAVRDIMVPLMTSLDVGGMNGAR